MATATETNFTSGLICSKYNEIRIEFTVSQSSSQWDKECAEYHPKDENTMAIQGPASQMHLKDMMFLNSIINLLKIKMCFPKALKMLLRNNLRLTSFFYSLVEC